MEIWEERCAAARVSVEVHREGSFEEMSERSVGRCFSRLNFHCINLTSSGLPAIESAGREDDEDEDGEERGRKGRDWYHASSSGSASPPLETLAFAESAAAYDASYAFTCDRVNVSSRSKLSCDFAAIVVASAQPRG